jgi:hypothetical protein
MSEEPLERADQAIKEGREAAGGRPDHAVRAAPARARSTAPATGPRRPRQRTRRRPAADVAQHGNAEE